jgi:hypothetical protein
MAAPPGSCAQGGSWLPGGRRSAASHRAIGGRRRRRPPPGWPAALPLRPSAPAAPRPCRAPARPIRRVRQPAAAAHGAGPGVRRLLPAHGALRGRRPPAATSPHRWPHGGPLLTHVLKLTCPAQLARDRTRSCLGLHAFRSVHPFAVATSPATPNPAAPCSPRPLSPPRHPQLSACPVWCSRPRRSSRTPWCNTRPRARWQRPRRPPLPPPPARRPWAGVRHRPTWAAQAVTWASTAAPCRGPTTRASPAGRAATMVRRRRLRAAAVVRARRARGSRAARIAATPACRRCPPAQVRVGAVAGRVSAKRLPLGGRRRHSSSRARVSLTSRTPPTA